MPIGTVPDWIVKTLAGLAALSVWVLIPLTAALWVVLFAPAPQGIDLEPIRREWGGWIFFALVVVGFLALARIAQWITTKTQAAIQGRRERAAERAGRVQYERDVRKHLDTLSADERETLKYLVENNERTAVGVLHSGVLHTLRTKGLLVVGSGVLSLLNAPHTVPGFVWEALLERKDELFGTDI